MKYRFYIETVDGQRVEWMGLSRAHAVSMYRATDKAMPVNVIRCGWGEVK